MKGNQCPSQGKGENGSVKGAASGKGVDEVAAAAGIGGGLESHHLISACRNEDRWAEKGKQRRGRGPG